MSLRIQALRCRACQGALVSAAGRPLASCSGCATAVDLRSGDTIPTWRPRRPERAGMEREPDAWLPFYRFQAAGPIWVAGFRCFQQESRMDLDRRLSDLGYDPVLEAAPIGVPVARRPAEAQALLQARGIDAPASFELVALPCRFEGDLLVEPVSGWSVLASLIAPPV